MKKILLFFVFILPFFTSAQVQIGSDIVGLGFGHFGEVVRLSGDGTIVAIGEPGFTLSDGVVHIYENNGGIWTLKGSRILGLNNDHKGNANTVSLSDNGDIVAVSALNTNNEAGLVRVYKFITTRTTPDWVQIGTDLNGSNSGEVFGRTVNLSGDGSILAVGMNVGLGRIRMYKNSGSNWVQFGSDITGIEENFGSSVSLSNNGNFIAIASHSSINFNPNGLVRVYHVTENSLAQVGTNLVHKVNETFGFNISLSDDGSTLAVSGFDVSNNPNIAFVRVYRNINDTWTQLGSDIIESEGGFGENSIKLSEDGNILAVGLPNFGGVGSNSGNVRVYKYTNNNWVRKGNLISGSGNQRMGWSVSLSKDGTILAAGAQGDVGYTGVYDLSAVLSTEDFVFTNTHIYPNPAEDRITIELKRNLVFQQVSIYNTLGKLVYTSASETIYLKEFSSGLYFVEIETNQGKARKKLVIN